MARQEAAPIAGNVLPLARMQLKSLLHMSTSIPPLTAREKQRRYRVRQREQGLRAVQLWVQDSTRKGFAGECRRQAQRINRAAGENATLAFVEAIADWDD